MSMQLSGCRCVKQALLGAVERGWIEVVLAVGGFKAKIAAFGSFYRGKWYSPCRSCRRLEFF
ncbi:hypothetical protein D3C72_2190960 [compost metagenome]